ncbi:hypothetical protein [Streptomyces sp. NPDC004629]|uniref:hypothetical protein n=1 Tax=Streptomyces sp. NPDC004629 TaxID=3364705 RepID=UPI0036A1CA54
MHATPATGASWLGVSLTGGSRNDVTQLLSLLDKVLAVAGMVTAGRARPRRLMTAGVW